MRADAAPATFNLHSGDSSNRRAPASKLQAKGDIKPTYLGQE
jgi:hypothetical protein